MKKKLVLHTAVWAAAFSTALTLRSHAQEEASLPTETPPAAAAPTSSFADPAEGKTISSVDVRYVGSGKVDKARVLSRLSLQPGQAYTKDKEEADIKSLVDSGDVEDVSISAVASGDSVKIVVTVQARAGLGDVTFIGNSAISADKLRTVVEDFKTGANVDNAKLQAATTELQDYYKKKGFTDVTVNYTVEPAANGFSRVIFKIDEGQKGYLRDLVFEGNNSIPAKELKKVMKSDNRGLTFWSGAKLEQEKIDADLRAIEAYYQDKGFVNAKVTGMERVRVDDKKVDLLIRISEGEIFSVSNVTMSGVKAYDPQTLIPAFALESGATFSGKNMKSDVQTIKSYYGSRGYADIKVTPQINSAGAGQVSVNYAVEEGSVYKVNEIRFTGNSATKDEVMRREMAITPGETYNQNTVDVSERRLRGLGYFKDLTIIPSDADTPGFKDININVTEQQTGQLNFGAGFSTIDNLVGFVDLRQTNFDIGSWPPVGAGQRFNMNVKAGTRRKDITVGWYEPWLLGNPLGFGVDLFYTEKTYLSDVYDQTNLGGDIYFRKKLNESSDLRLQLLSENVTIDNIDEDASDLIKAEEGDYLHNELTLTYNYDTRDDNVLPRKGFKFAADISAAFGDVQDVGFGLQFSKPWHLPLDMVFTVSGSFETVDGDDVPIFERVFLGGANNLRGFDYRDVGPKDENGEPLGGASAWFISSELTFPIMERVRGAAFVDAGSVDSESFSVGGDVNSDYGLGLRLNLPVFGPLKLDYAIPLQGDEFNDNSGRFQISVDYKF
jgi:outer membrane protein insertion porin family